MLSRLLFAIERGWKTAFSNGKLIFLTVVLFIFPLLFVVVLERFYTVAAVNVESAEQQRIGAMHDSVESLLRLDLQRDDLVGEVIESVASENSDISKFRVYQDIGGDVVQIMATDQQTEYGATSTIAEVLKIGRLNEGVGYSVQLQDNSGRIIQAVRYVEVGDKKLYIFSEHARGTFDTLLAKRKLDAYLLLSLIFVFMIGLAYWINRQTDWEKSYNKLSDTLKERDLFSNMIAHEFRTPLTAIKGYASFLQESKTLSADESRYADTIRDSAERLVLLVNDFLEVARIQSGRMKLEFSEIDVRDVITEVSESLQGKATEKELNLVYTPGLSPQLLVVDRNRFVQVLTNIISNSIKYTNSGTVEISAEETRKGITIRVKDTGMGISAEDQQKLFAPFSRVGGVEKTTTTGTGLGMWITKQLVELLHGTIAVESIKNVGTHVVLQFERKAKKN